LSKKIFLHFFLEKAGADYSVDEKTDKKTTGNVQQII
jgi:hypothetical protein